MKPRVTFVERQKCSFVSIERVFRHVNDALGDRFEAAFVQLQHNNGLLGLIKNLFTFKRPASDIYHVTGHAHYITLRLPGDRTVLTVHDLFFMNNRSGLRLSLLKKLYLDWPLKRAEYVTTISTATRDEIAKYLPDVAQRIIVIENPLDPQFTYSPKEFNSDKPSILQLGTIINKNVPRLIRALNGLSCSLIIVGKIDAEIAAELATTSIEFRTIDRLEDGELTQAYRDADIISFCSTYEGFGLPVIEAQAIGRVVVTSDISPLREVAGGGAELVDPFDEMSIRSGFERVISNAKHRERLISIGQTNVERFAAENIAAKYAELYEQVLAENT